MSCKLNVILDLDNTLIHSIGIKDINTIPPFWRNKGTKLLPGDFITFKRPHLEKFLTFLFDNFNVGVFTAASKDYAREIVWQFVQKTPGRKVDFLLSRLELEASQQMYGADSMKKLNYIWDYLKVYDYYPCNTIIIDDNLYVKQSNYYNTLSVYPFFVTEDGSEDDSTLLEAIDALKDIKKNYDASECTIDHNNTRCSNLRLSPNFTKDVLKTKTFGRFKVIREE